MKELDTYYACCHANYQWLWRLLPAKCQPGDVFFWSLKHGTLSIYIEENNPYSDNLIVKQQLFENLSWLKSFTLYLRHYHDARTSEVIAYQNIEGIKCRFSYSKTERHSQEKWQMNRLLYETLALCFSLRKQ